MAFSSITNHHDEVRSKETPRWTLSKLSSTFRWQFRHEKDHPICCESSFETTGIFGTGNTGFETGLGTRTRLHRSDVVDVTTRHTGRFRHRHGWARRRVESERFRRRLHCSRWNTQCARIRRSGLSRNWSTNHVRLWCKENKVRLSIDARQ